MTEKKMTEAEIMKALECCKAENSCDGCPYEFDGEFCEDQLKEDTIDLIKSKNAEIERLTTLSKLGNMRANDYRVMRDRVLKSEAEIAEARAEAIKEVYTRLSMNFGTYTDDDSVKLVDLFRLFDQIAKEMGVEL